MTTWNEISELIEATGAKNVRVDGETLRGNDNLILTFHARIALDYVRSDWDAINCRPEPSPFMKQWGK